VISAGRRIPTSNAVPVRSWATTRGEERLAREDEARREWLNRVTRRAPNGGRSHPTLCDACGREFGIHSTGSRLACARKRRMVALTLVVDDEQVRRERSQ